MLRERVLTVQPLGVVLDGPLEGVPLLPCTRVVEVGAEDDRVGLRELGHGPAVQAGQTGRVAALYTQEHHHHTQED